MNNQIWIMPGNGPFSRFLQCGIIPLADIDFDKVFLSLSLFDEQHSDDQYLRAAVDHITRNRWNMEMYGIERPYDHIMGYVLNQNADRDYEYRGFLPVGKMYNSKDPIEHSERLSDYKRVLRKLHIRQEIIKRVDDLCKLVKINEKTLAVHVRMTTATVHADQTSVSHEDYVKTIDQELATGEYDGLYVATDNVESLVKMEQRYGRIIRYYPSLLRLPTESIKSVEEWSWKYDMFFHKKFWQESFMECMTLARCGGLVCRDSNFSNMAVVFSDTLKRISRIGTA